MLYCRKGLWKCNAAKTLASIECFPRNNSDRIRQNHLFEISQPCKSGVLQLCHFGWDDNFFNIFECIFVSIHSMGIFYPSAKYITVKFISFIQAVTIPDPGNRCSIHRRRELNLLTILCYICFIDPTLAPVLAEVGMICDSILGDRVFFGYIISIDYISFCRSLLCLHLCRNIAHAASHHRQRQQ